MDDKHFTRLGQKGLRISPIRCNWWLAEGSFRTGCGMWLCSGAARLRQGRRTVVCNLWYDGGGVGSAENDQKSRALRIHHGACRLGWSFSEGTDSQCSSQPWTRWILNKIGEKSNTIWINPESHSADTLGELITIQKIGAIKKLAQRKRLQFYHTRSHAITLSSTRFVLKKWYA